MSTISIQLRIAVVLMLPTVIVALLIIVAMHYWHPSERVFSILSGVLSSLITLFSTTIVLYLVARLFHKTTKAKFLKFFGDVTAENRGALLVFSSRQTGSDTKIIWESVPDTLGIVQPLGAIPKGISDWFPAQDFRGANYISGELAKQTGQTAFYRTDADLLSDTIDQLRATVISFGLGFNHFTHRIIRCTEQQLFTVEFFQYPNEPHSDQIIIPGFGPLKPPNGLDYAIVVRVAYAPIAGAKSRYFFICAGRTATGTAVAGRYLATRWREMRQMYDEDGRDLASDSLLVVLSHTYAPPKHGEDDHCEVCMQGDTQFRLWWPKEKGEAKPRDLLYKTGTE